MEGAAVPPGRPCLTCPRANQGRAQSPRSLRGWARWHSRCQAPVHCLPMLSHAGCNLVLVHIPPRAGVQGLEPRSPRASHSEPLSLCQTVLGLSAQDCRTLDRWAGLVLLSSSGSPACPRYTVKDPAQSGRQHQDGPLPTPVLSLWGLVVQQSWGAGLPRQSRTLGLALSAQWVLQARGPRYLDSSPSRYSRAIS